jgi:hypothetical protein
MKAIDSFVDNYNRMKKNMLKWFNVNIIVPKGLNSRGPTVHIHTECNIHFKNVWLSTFVLKKY